ncbi:hypothetical protein [Bradyrhizobium sp. RDM4]
MMISIARPDNGCWITRRFLSPLERLVETRMLTVEVKQLNPTRTQQFT